MATHTLLTNEPLDLARINDLVLDDACGAVSLFIGTTRDNFNDKKVLSLEYEAYEPMALKQMNLICSDLRAQWPDVRNIAIHHRLGLVPVRESSVVIAVSSPHRQTALTAVSFAIDELKKRVPIFKKEQYENGCADWKENKECPWLTNKSNISPNCKQVQKSEANFVQDNLVQIAAEDNEIQRRIQCFINKKRDEINQNNIVDFSLHDSPTASQSSGIRGGEGEYSCARAYSYIVKQEHSKGHLRVRRVNNSTGPQTRPNYSQEIDKLMSTENKAKLMLSNLTSHCKNEQVSERLNTIEEYIGTSNSRFVFQRIKELESRILYLESLSPEYRHFLNFDGEGGKDVKTSRSTGESCSTCIMEKKPTKRKLYTVQELNEFVRNLECKQKYIES